MSASADLQQAIADLLSAPGALRVAVPILTGKGKDLVDKINEAAAKQGGLMIHVLPPLPTGAEQGVPFVFFNRAEIRVRITELVPVNMSSTDAYDLFDDVAQALHWAPRGFGLIVYSTTEMPMIVPSATNVFEPDGEFPWRVGDRIRVARVGAPASQWMEGPISSIDGTEVAFVVEESLGGGMNSYSDWQITSAEAATGLAAILAHPLQLAARPADAVEGMMEGGKGMVRVIDVIFEAVYGFQPSE